MRHLSINHTGFTLVELIIVVTVTGLLIGMLFGPLYDLFDSNNSTIKSFVQTTDTRGALRTIEKDVTLASQFYDANQVGDPLGPNNNADGMQWSWASGNVLITANYATTQLKSLDTANTRSLVYYGASCDQPLINNTVYFVKNGDLYRRLIKNLTTPCSGYAVSQKQTCAPGVANAACEAVDAKIASNVTAFKVDYYLNSASSSTMADQYTNTTVPGQAQTVIVTLTTIVGAGTGATTVTNSLRITRINGATT